MIRSWSDLVFVAVVLAIGAAAVAGTLVSVGIVVHHLATR